jgi:nitrogen-specific signal transduction histidine kinase
MALFGYVVAGFSGSAGMIDTGPAGGRDGAESTAEGDAMTLSRLRHDIRNCLNTIKLSTALLHRQRGDKPGLESLREIDKAADGINELVSRFMGDADAPGLFQPNSDPASAEK